jgi:predicted phosphoribosyltransferase
MGAIASGGVRILSEDVIEALGIPDRDIAGGGGGREDEPTAGSTHTAVQTPPAVGGKTVILVDDGLATGSIHARRGCGGQDRGAAPGIAVPVAPAATCQSRGAEVDEVVCLHPTASTRWAVVQELRTDQRRGGAPPARDRRAARHERRPQGVRRGAQMDP